jgi:mono/diheme cytochrome c family protein
VKKRWIAFFFGLLALTGCDNMYDQPKYKPLQPSPFFADGRSSRTPVPDTVARGEARIDRHFYQGKVNGKVAETLPFPVTPEVLARGRERFNIFCSVCHGRLGDGQGMVVQRGFPPPPSYHIARLREAPIGYFFDVMTNGFGVMYSYADRVPVKDRWAIAAYIRALQLSQNASLNDVPAEARAQLEATQ